VERGGGVKLEPQKKKRAKVCSEEHFHKSGQNGGGRKKGSAARVKERLGCGARKRADGMAGTAKPAEKWKKRVIISATHTPDRGKGPKARQWKKQNSLPAGSDRTKREIHVEGI